MGKELELVLSSLKVFTQSGVKALILETHANLVRAPGEGGTPRDTGWAATNWLASIGAPITEPEGSPDLVLEAAAQIGLFKVVTSYTLEQGPAFLSNNVPYIQRLNEGSSTQAPPAFVQSAIADAVRAVDIAPI